MTEQKVAISRLEQPLFEPRKHQCRITLRDLRHQYADVQRVSSPQRARQHIRPVVELLCCGKYPLLRRLWNRLRSRNRVEYPRDRSSRQPQMRRQRRKRSWPTYFLRLVLLRYAVLTEFRHAVSLSHFHKRYISPEIPLDSPMIAGS